MATKINEKELKELLDNEADVLLLDVLPPEYFNEKHIAGAKNAPVYEVVFLEHVQKLTEDKNKKIVVYNERVDSLASMDAAAKLEQDGFKQVFEFSGGLSKWEAAGYPVEKGEPVKNPHIEDGAYGIEREKSVVAWTGRNFKYAHRGTIAVKKGAVSFREGKLIGGKFSLDMATIRDLDLTDGVLRGVLESHLKSSDFFDVATFPVVSFEFKNAEKVNKARIGTPNYRITGALSIKDVTKEIVFSAMVVPVEDGLLYFQANFDFDRTLWNVRYGSEKFFEKLGTHLVNDMISLDLFLAARK